MSRRYVLVKNHNGLAFGKVDDARPEGGVGQRVLLGKAAEDLRRQHLEVLVYQYCTIKIN